MDDSLDDSVSLLDVENHPSCDDDDDASAENQSKIDYSDAGNVVKANDEAHCHHKMITSLTCDDIRGLEFGSEEHAFKFYEAYANSHGFVIRKSCVRRDPKGNIIRRLLVCNRAGLRSKVHLARVNRKREHRPLTRTNCQAQLKVHLDYNTSKWKVSSFQETHNHVLTPVADVHLIPKYRALSEADKAQVDSLHSFGVRTCHIMGYLLDQKGGHAGIGFSKRDLYNHFHKKQRDIIKDGDARVTLSYFEGKADNDPMFYSKFQTTGDGKLKHLFWADGRSRSDFQCFGDVLAFDTTYKKNKYNKPLVIFSGCNHHSQTTIFGCALLGDETIETYKWVLEAFLDAMHNKHPISVVTEYDAMNDHNMSNK
ncbi:unnamed protein product [Cuscuta epithymum]|uniref:Protein FAR1-RELATED SEQUENCE n=1 Tax=Cuscuta epithymum TaxID=186058 RepID=A0AAV0ETT6_9ASTE|nr:unnamed protein product [Cuscuta epithymum]